jgi:arginine N-succinyltransferase
LSRFLYIALNRKKFEDRILCELTPPLTDEGRSEFWEALGRRFTGLPYQEADLLSQSHKEFIKSLFPQEDVYLCLLDAKARSVVGRVGEATKPAQHLLESIGFEYLEEVDPFDGGPHYGARTDEILPIKLSRKLKLAEFKDASFKNQGLLAVSAKDFKCTMISYDLRSNEVAIPDKERSLLKLDLGEEVLVAPFIYEPSRKEQR